MGLKIKIEKREKDWKEEQLKYLLDESTKYYDKKILNLYTQTTLTSNDFINMLDSSSPYYVSNNSNFNWKIDVDNKTGSK